MRALLFEELMEAVEALEVLQEYLTYDQLYRMSEPKRFWRSHFVRIPPMEVESYQTPNHWVFAYYFNAKSAPGHSTTGLRHRGYVRFRKPKRSQKGKNTPLSQLAVEVDCMCPDYRYRWAWANHQKRAGPIGKGSLNQCKNKAPKHTNPKGVPGLCKHILATRDFIYGLLSGFPESVGPTDRLDKLTKRATKRWLNFDADMAAARERDAKIAAAKARRNIGLPPERQNKLPNKLEVATPPELPGIPMEPWHKVPLSPQELKAKYGKAPAPPKAPEAPKPPKAPTLATPPGERGRGLPPAKPPGKPAPKGKAAPKPQPKPAKKKAAPGALNKLLRRQFLGNRFLKTEGVDSMTNMKTLLTLQETKRLEDARKLVVEMGDDLGGLDDVGEMPPPSGTDMPLEPPMSDSAVGASTQDNVALGLLREIRDLLADLAAAEAGEGGEAPEIPEEELEPGEGASEEELGGDEEFRPGKRPMPVPTGAE